MIKRYDNIILIGTSHVAKQSAKEINETIDKYLPKVVAIELDIDRFKGLMSHNPKANKKRRNSLLAIKEIGLSGFLFSIIAGYVQEKVGKSLGIKPGIDMKTAYLSARDKKIPVALIDINIKNTLKKLSKIPFTKKIGMFSKLFFKGFNKKYRNQLQFDVKKGVPDEKVIEKMLNIVKIEIPLLYKVLIDDRNKYMCKKLLELSSEHNGEIIIGVVGAGHLAGMGKILEKEINSNSIEQKIVKVDSNNSISYSFRIEQ